ncbi:hypothetical protein GCM10010862_39410 [Devosia nitrariae]|uniref:Uncharacterized protein n=1 Tax=Devosia nitrariae TaxID=2071872 RepID=A0ABQ5W9N6_9HYPH|nr:hypothetical protein GCM10010862_39410 [Devosia nitrariae]
MVPAPFAGKEDQLQADERRLAGTWAGMDMVVLPNGRASCLVKSQRFVHRRGIDLLKQRVNVCIIYGS